MPSLSSLSCALMKSSPLLLDVISSAVLLCEPAFLFYSRGMPGPMFLISLWWRRWNTNCWLCGARRRQRAWKTLQPVEAFGLNWSRSVTLSKVLWRYQSLRCSYPHVCHVLAKAIVAKLHSQRRNRYQCLRGMNEMFLCFYNLWG